MPDQQGFCSQKTISFFLCNPSIAHDKFTMLRMRRPRRTITIALAGTPATQEQGTCLCPSPPYSSCPRAAWLRRMSCFSFSHVQCAALALCPQIIALPPSISVCCCHHAIVPSCNPTILSCVLRPASCVLALCGVLCIYENHFRAAIKLNTVNVSGI